MSCVGQSVENLPTVFGSNAKAQIAAKTTFHLAHQHGDILREGWKNIMDAMLQLFRAELLPKSMVEVREGSSWICSTLCKCNKRILSEVYCSGIGCREGKLDTN